MAIAIRSSNGTIEYFTSTSNTSQTVDLSDAAVGDVRVIILNASPDGTGTVPSDYTITGWTSLFTSTATGAASNSRISGFYRVVQSGDTLTSATLGITFDNTSTVGSICVTLEGVDTTNVLDAASPTPNTGTGNAISPTMTTVTDNAWVGRVAANDAAPGFTDTSIPSGTTLIGTMANNPPANGMNLGFAYELQVTAGAVGTATWSDGGSEEYVGATFAIRPVTVTREQDSFRFEDDDGTESGSTFLDAQNTDITIGQETNFRVRVGAQMAGDAPTEAGTLQYKETSDAATEWKDA